MAAHHADTWLMWGEPPGRGRRAGRARCGRWPPQPGARSAFGIRLHVITRDRAEDAWAETDRLLDAMPAEVVAAAQQHLADAASRSASGAWRALHGGRRDDLVVAPNLWAGFGLVRSGAGTALVGSHDEVADRIAEYHEVGFDHVILSGQPHLEEAYWFGEGVIPRLRQAGLLADAASVPGRVDPRGAPATTPEAPAPVRVLAPASAS